MAHLFDYTNQAWTMDGIYMDCGHPAGCACYGKAHAGEAVPAKIIAEMDERERDLLKHRRNFIDSISGRG